MDFLTLSLATEDVGIESYVCRTSLDVSIITSSVQEGGKGRACERERDRACARKGETHEKGERWREKRPITTLQNMQSNKPITVINSQFKLPSFGINCQLHYRFSCRYASVKKRIYSALHICQTYASISPYLKLK